MVQPSIKIGTIVLVDEQSGIFEAGTKDVMGTEGLAYMEL